MIDLHGQEAWDAAVAEQKAIDEAGGVALAERLSEEEIAAAVEPRSPTRPRLAPASR